MNHTNRLAFVLVLLGICGLALIVLADSAEGQGFVQVSASFNDASKDADVAPGKSGTVTFQGMIDVLNPTTGDQTTVSLRVNSRWPAVISPSAFVVQQSSQIPFSVTVIVPPRTLRSDTANIEVGGTWQTLSSQTGNVNPAGAVVNILQYFQLSMECNRPYQEVSPGDEMTFVVWIHNEGNEADDFDLDIGNLKRLNDGGWTIQISKTSMTIYAREKDKFTLSVNTPKDWTIWKTELSQIELLVTSKGSINVAGGDELLVTSETYPLTIYEKGMYIPDFDPILVVCGLIAGIMIFGRRRIEA